MEFNSNEYLVYKNINFLKRFKKLSDEYQFEKRLDYSNDKVLNLIEKLKQKAKYIKKNNFFKIEHKIENVKFYLHICLKYSNVELIIGASDTVKDEFISGGVFSGLYDDISYAEGITIDDRVKKPKFRNYQDLENILSVAFGIYEDFKISFLDVFVYNNDSNESDMILSHEFSLLDSKLESFVSDLKINGYSNFEYFENIREDIKKGKKRALEQLKSSFAITQYANFSKDLEDKLSDIISLC